jgi:hypothetical protein
MGKKNKNLNDYGEPFLICPECSSRDVTVCAEQAFMANTGDHYCHSVKTHDSDSRSFCTKCDWEGQRQDLISESASPNAEHSKEEAK